MSKHREIEIRLDELEGVDKLVKNNKERRQAYPDWDKYFKERTAFLRKQQVKSPIKSKIKAEDQVVGVSKITNFKPTSHDECAVQYLGVNYSLGYSFKAYFCPKHQEAFTVSAPLRGGRK